MIYRGHNVVPGNGTVVRLCSLCALVSCVLLLITYYLLLIIILITYYTYSYYLLLITILITVVCSLCACVSYLICVSVCLCVCVSVCLCVCVSVCLCVVFFAGFFLYVDINNKACVFAIYYYSSTVY